MQLLAEERGTEMPSRAASVPSPSLPVAPDVTPEFLLLKWANRLLLIVTSGEKWHIHFSGFEDSWWSLWRPRKKWCLCHLFRSYIDFSTCWVFNQVYSNLLMTKEALGTKQVAHRTWLQGHIRRSLAQLREFWPQSGRGRNLWTLISHNKHQYPEYSSSWAAGFEAKSWGFFQKVGHGIKFATHKANK